MSRLPLCLDTLDDELRMRAHTHTHAFTAGHEGDHEGQSALDRFAAALARHTSKCEKAHAAVCCRMLTYADVCCRMLTYAEGILTHADVC